MNYNPDVRAVGVINTFRNAAAQRAGIALSFSVELIIIVAFFGIIGKSNLYMKRKMSTFNKNRTLFLSTSSLVPARSF